MSMIFQHERLSNGLDMIVESNPFAYSVAVGFFVRTGSRDETAEISGVSHFLEHMAFKGNDRYTADDVNRIFDEIGARYNASTSEEVTLFYAAILPEYLPQAFDLLSALLYPSLRPEDFDLEKQVILEEIGMYEDAPGFLAYDHVMRRHFSGHPLGQSILGTDESVAALTVQQMRDYHFQRYRAGNITLAVAGKVDFDTIQMLAEQHCSDWPPGTCARPIEEAVPIGGSSVISRPSHHQQHIMQLAPAPPAASELRFAAELLSVIVGDDSGSRLYWQLVDPGHAEAAELSYNDYEGSGCWATYLSCAPDQTAENLARVAEIYHQVNTQGVSEEELDQARNKLASRIVLASERPMGRLSSLGGNWVYRKEYRTVRDDLDVVRRLTLSDIQALLDAYPLGQTTTVGVGPLEQIPSQPPANET